MVGPHGDGFSSRDIHGGNFLAIQQYFQKRSCRFCSNHYTAEGIELLREEPGVLVVRVGCASCGRPLGIALVGMNATQSQAQAQGDTLAQCVQAQPTPARVRQHPPEWTNKDVNKLSGKPPINYDDLLNVHEFLDRHASDWSKFLPVKTRRASSAAPRMQ